MTKKQILFLLITLIAYVTGVISTIFILSWHHTSFGIKEGKAYKDINYVLRMKLKDDDSYAQRCDDNGRKQIEENWPLGASSFFVIVDDHFRGSYECRVFFDTGDIYYIETSSYEDGTNKVTYFKKGKWLNCKTGGKR